MLSERLQILVTVDQRRRLESEAKRRDMSVGAVIRDAVDAQLGGTTRERRLEALERIRAMRGPALSPEELNRIVEQERDDAAAAILAHYRR